MSEKALPSSEEAPGEFRLENFDIFYVLPFLKRGAVVFLEDYRGSSDLVSRFEKVTSSNHLETADRISSYSDYFDCISLSMADLKNPQSLIPLREALKTDGILAVRVSTNPFGLGDLKLASLLPAQSPGVFRRRYVIPDPAGLFLLLSNRSIDSEVERGQLQKPYGKEKSLKRLHQIRLSHLQQLKTQLPSAGLDLESFSTDINEIRHQIRHQDPRVVFSAAAFLQKAQQNRLNPNAVVADLLNRWEAYFRVMPTIFCVYLLPIVFEVIEKRSGDDLRAFRPQLYRVIKEVWELHYSDLDETSWQKFFEKSQRFSA